MDTLQPSYKGKLSFEQYLNLYKESIQHPEEFWSKQAKQYLTWFKPWQKVCEGDFAQGKSRWFVGGSLNVCYNCVDRHLPEKAKDTAIIWEADEPSESLSLTYEELYEKVCTFASVLKSLGVTKGDRVCIYMPMIIESVVAMLACARIGAVHSVVFGGFSAHALKSRIQDAQCKILITADGAKRGGKLVSLKDNVNAIIDECESVFHTLVIKHLGNEVEAHKKDVWFHDINTDHLPICEPEEMQATDPLFILYTSGSTGKPKGILHGTGGYLLYTAMTFDKIFNAEKGDVYWCTADIGWITGHSYIVYGPLANGATTLLFAGTPQYPTASRFWEVIDKHKVNIFYTAPTALRALMREGDEPLKNTTRSSLKLLGSVGEPINPEVWMWYYEVIGKSRCPIVDTWWQTETGGMLISPIPGCTPLKPGSATLPFFGIHPAILDAQGHKQEGECEGNLVIQSSWPGQLQTIYGDEERYKQTYFSSYKGFYTTGDGAKRDADGFYWITGRVDDVINVSGHRLDTAEIESAIVLCDGVAEAAVVGMQHDIKGQCVCAFVTPKKHMQADESLIAEIKKMVKEEIGGIAIPDVIVFTEDLPKTRSGKIMRRILRKIVNGEGDSLGDLSTLSNPEVVEAIKIKVKKLLS